MLVIGPTGIGKSEMAFLLAKEHDGEIVSIDSCAVYRSMDIGTAKPSAAQRGEIEHHLIDIREPNQNYNVGDFFRDSQQAVTAIQQRGRLAILVGGTMMYVNALLEGLIAKPTIDDASKTKARELVAELGAVGAHQKLAKLDPKRAAKLSINDYQRLIRSFEIHFATSRKPSEFETAPVKFSCAHTQLYVVPADRASYRKRLVARFDAMLEAGLVSEVKRLIDQYGIKIDAMRTVGYRQIAAHVIGEISLDEAREKGILATWHLAKRQMTWIRKFRPEPDRIVEVD